MILSHYNPVDIEAALRSHEPSPPFPTVSNRKAWQTVMKNDQNNGEIQISRIIREAEFDLESDIPDLPATVWLEYKREGWREGYQDPRNRRREMLANLVLAECLENEGRFLDAILDVAWSICEESSWVLPAHMGDLPDPEHPQIDLGSATTALELAELDSILGVGLDPALRKRIRYEVDRRCLSPYLNRHDHWWLYNTNHRRVNNWTAVCNAGVVGAAIYLERDLARLAEIIARAARSLDDYLATFDPDGGSSEGPGYWNYGFGGYVLLAHLVEARTGGQINFFEDALISKVASYPLKTLLSPDVYVNFSDCDTNVMLNKSLLAFLAQRLDLPDLAALANMQLGEGGNHNLIWALRNLFWRIPEDTPEFFDPNPHDWYAGMMWMIARYDPKDPRALVLAAKGGHNGEMHNQNDVGNFIVHVEGDSVIADIGRGRYTKAYFGPERYDHLVNASLGHSVPVPNGQLQEAGPDYAAVLLDYQVNDDEDSLELDLKGAYPPEANLQTLTRRIVLHREGPQGWVELSDTFAFQDNPAPFETALITFGQVEIGDDGLVIQADRGKLRVTFDPELVSVEVETYQDVELGIGEMDVQRIVFQYRQEALSGVVRLEIVPVS